MEPEHKPMELEVGHLYSCSVHIISFENVDKLILTYARFTTAWKETAARGFTIILSGTPIFVVSKTVTDNNAILVLVFSTDTNGISKLGWIEQNNKWYNFARLDN